MQTVQADHRYTRDNPSPRYLELIGQYQQLHANGSPDHGIEAREMFPGQSLLEHINPLLELTHAFKFKTMMDYGCGKAMLYRPNNDIKLTDGRSFNSLQALLGVDVTLYDPAYLPYAMRPQEQSDLVVCTDVLEHCSQEDVQWIVDDLFSYAREYLYANIACYPAAKQLPNGENAHCTIEDVEWWRSIVEQVARNHTTVAYRFICTHGDGSIAVITNT